MKKLVFVSFFILCSNVVRAQGITSYNFRQYLAGAVSPVTPPYNFLSTATVCNQVPPATQAVHTILWDDINNVGQVCIWTDPGTGPLFAKVYGALEGTLTSLAGTLESAESARSPFSKTPLAPTTLKVKP